MSIDGIVTLERSRKEQTMNTAIPEVLGSLGESEFSVLTSAYCKLQQVREQIGAMHDVYLADGTPPSFPRIKAVQFLVDDLFSEIEGYVLALADPAERICSVYDKAA